MPFYFVCMVSEHVRDHVVAGLPHLGMFRTCLRRVPVMSSDFLHVHSSWCYVILFLMLYGRQDFTQDALQYACLVDTLLTSEARALL